MFKTTDVQNHRCSKLQVFKTTDIQNYRCFKLQMFKTPDVQATDVTNYLFETTQKNTFIK